MKNWLIFLVVSLMSLMTYGQELPSDFKIFQVNKKIKDFPDTIDLSSPLKSCISYYYISINGQDRLLYRVSTIIHKADMPDSTIADSKVSEEVKTQYLNITIKEILVYKDSVACAICDIGRPYYSIRCFTLENGKWVNFCEDGRNSISESRIYFVKRANQYLHALPSFNSLAVIPTDTLSYINYLKNNGYDPIEFILDKLSKYKLVMLGEIHRRKVSWDFLKNVVNDERFPRNTGVIFMEMASHKQKDIDKFLANDTIDKELLLNVFREYVDVGWNDKGMFDFIIEVWKINKKLPNDRRIKIIAADTPRPFSSFQSLNDMINNDAKYDRDEFMASTILNYVNSMEDNRNALFISGTSHICKTIESAGSIISKKILNNSYTIFEHSPRNDDGRIRYGMFDYAFYKTGDHPIAFELKNSPFGKEPFDGLYPEGFGRYQDNYDGYIFFGSLDNEPNGEILLDLYSDKFINEIDRRLHLEGTSLKEDWGLKEVSRNAVIKKILENQAQTKTKWENYIKPLNAGKNSR